MKVTIVLIVFALLNTNVVLAKRGSTVSPLSKVSNISKQQITLLNKAGISSVKELSTSKPTTLSRILRISSRNAGSLIRSAKARQSKFNNTYAIAKTKFKIDPRVLRAVRGGGYASLIAPTNECTLLVRKVCGSTNQCSSSPGCPVAKQLLDRYNSEVDSTVTAESCLMSLEDSIVFNACNH